MQNIHRSYLLMILNKSWKQRSKLFIVDSECCISSLSECLCLFLSIFMTDFALILWYAEFLHSCIFDLSNVITCILNIPFTETEFLNEFVFLQFTISSSEKSLILVLGTNFLVSSAELSESCMIGLSFFILITWHLKIDLTLPPIPSATPTPWQVVENFQIIFFLHWRDKSSINCQMNWFSNFEDGPSDQMISECHYPELVALNIYHAEILQSQICLCLYSWLSRSLTLFLPCGRQHK